jgi:asparagine synthase (glutamine-hydrolysing)
MGAIYGEAGPAPSAAHRDRALELLAHRGHGAPGGWSAPGIVLGARGSGPAVDHTGQRCAVLDGAILNERALRVELGCTAGGAALVLHAFERWGSECLERFNGMFAIALWDGPSRALWLARDRVGERPLSYLAAGGRIVFASEIKAILVDERIDRRVDPRALAGFLTFANSGSELTMFEGIRKLAPGHWLRFADRVVTVRLWWDVDVAAIGSARQSETQLAGELRDLLEDAVRLRVTSEAPVGAFLSGGVDSAAVTALMRRHSGAPVHTFTLAYEEGGVFDELEHARANARALGSEHHELRAGHGDLITGLRSLVYHCDEPLGIAASFNFLLLARLAAEHVGVVLTGDGGDELFGGYRRHVAEQLAPAWGRLPHAIGEAAVPALLARLPRLGRTRQIATVLPIADPGRRAAAWLTVLEPDLRAELLAPSLRAGAGAHDAAGALAACYGTPGPRGRLGHQLYAELKAWLPGTLFEKTDRPTRAAGVEARMPLFDHRIVELAFRIPDRHKVRGRATKRVLRTAVRGLAPEPARRRRKHGFTIPTDPWLRGPVASYAREILFDERARRRGYFDTRVVERLFEEHHSGRRIWDRALWMLLNFELWHRIYLDREGI